MMFINTRTFESGQLCVGLRSIGLQAHLWSKLAYSDVIPSVLNVICHL